MNSQAPAPRDRRRERTRRAIIQAFNSLVREGRLEHIKVPDVIERANVGRSTFYDHFSNVTEVYLTAFSRPLGILADTLAGHNNRADLEALLQHLWDNRHQARSAFSGRGREQICGLLRKLVRERIAGADDVQCSDSSTLALNIVQHCEGAMGLIRAWLIQDINSSLSEVAEAIMSVVSLSAADQADSTRQPPTRFRSPW